MIEKSIFQTWSFKRTQFLAFPMHPGESAAWRITDEQGNNYGACSSVETFRKAQVQGDAIAKPITGKVFLSCQVL